MQCLAKEIKTHRNDDQITEMVLRVVFGDAEKLGHSDHSEDPNDSAVKPARRFEQKRQHYRYQHDCREDAFHLLSGGSVRLYQAAVPAFTLLELLNGFE